MSQCLNLPRIWILESAKTILVFEAFSIAYLVFPFSPDIRPMHLDKWSPWIFLTKGVGLSKLYENLKKSLSWYNIPKEDFYVLTHHLWYQRSLCKGHPISVKPMNRLDRILKDYHFIIHTVIKSIIYLPNIKAFKNSELLCNAVVSSVNSEVYEK